MFFNERTNEMCQSLTTRTFLKNRAEHLQNKNEIEAEYKAYCEKVDQFLIKRLHADDATELCERRAKHKSEVGFFGLVALQQQARSEEDSVDLPNEA